MPDEDIRSIKDAGAVQVLYGSASGPTSHDQFWHQGSKGVRGALEKSDRFGEALASGDFNSDGYADLAIGIPRENVGKPNAGTVQVLYGSSTGLTAARDQVWHQGSAGVPGKNEKNDRFGASLAAGDFNGDGHADLAIGAPWEGLGAAAHSGNVVVLPGSDAGLTVAGVQSWSQASSGIAGEPRSDGFFGTHLASGDVSGDGIDDLTVAARGKSPAGNDDPQLHLLLGSDGGLTATGSQAFGLSSLGTPSGVDVESLWLGDVNDDSHADLAVGSANHVDLLHGHADGFHPGPVSAPDQPGTDAVWAGYGGAASGDVTGDGHADLVLVGLNDQVAIAFGTSDGIGSEVAIVGEQRTWFRRPNLLPLSGGTKMWIVMGDWADDVGSSATAGSVTVLQATAAGTPASLTKWTQDSPGIRDWAERRDEFGYTVG